MKKILFSLITLLITGSPGLSWLSAQCNSHVNISLDHQGTAVLYAEDVLQGNITDFSNLSWQTQEFSCSNIGLDTLDISGDYQGAPFQCSVTVGIQDKMAPVAIVDQYSNIVVSGTYTFQQGDLDDGSYDNCSISSFSYTPAQLDSTMVGTIIPVLVKISDATGLTSLAFSNVYVSDSSSDAIACIQGLRVNPFQYIFPEDILEGAPTCPNGYDLELTDSQGNLIPDNYVDSMHICDTLNAVVTSRCNGNKCWSQIIVNCDSIWDCTNDITRPVPYAITGKIVFVGDDPVILNPREFDAGSYDNCTAYHNLDFSVEPNVVLPSDIGSVVEVLFTVKDEAGNEDYAQIHVVVISNDNNDKFYICDSLPRSAPIGDCNSGHTLTDNVEWPNDLSINDHRFSPDELIHYHNIDPRDARPEIINPVGPDRHAVSTYNDNVFDSGNGYVKVVRNWTIIEWFSGNTWTYAQIIEANAYQDSTDFYICDFLPRTTPVTDCVNGHTLEDHAEWPSDINVSDPRINPQELLIYNNVDFRDAEPQIERSIPNTLPALAYSDVVFDQGTDDIHVKRTWRVIEWHSGNSWGYVQNIYAPRQIIDSLVTVKDAIGRAVPDVVVDNGFGTQITDDYGRAKISIEDKSLSLQKNDVITQGINVKDVYMLVEHITGMTTMDSIQKLALGDLQVPTISDVYNLMDLILKSETQDEFGNWNFREESNIFSDYSKIFTGVKIGDFDHSSLIGQGNYPISSLELIDALIYNGQSYDLPLNMSAITNGYQMSFKIDPSIVDISTISFNNEDIKWHLKNDELNLIFANPISDFHNKELNFTMTFKALQNSTLSRAVRFNSDAEQWMLDASSNLVRINGEYDEEIPVSTMTEAFDKGIAFAPNPTKDFFRIYLDDSVSTKDMNINIYDASGRLVLSQIMNDTQINVSHMEAGIYMITAQNGEQSWIGKLIKM